MNPYFKDLGIGVGLRPAHYHEFLNNIPKSVSWVEVISENYMPWKGRPLGKSFQTLEKIRSRLPVVLHGVSLSIGSVDELDFDYLNRLKLLIDRIEPAWVSDHLCWTGVSGQNSHDLLPLPYNEETLNLVVKKWQTVQDFLGRKMLIENPSSYLEFNNSEMTEWEFVKQLLIGADCGLLLDINNVYVSSINHNFDPKLYLQSLPKERIGQIHLAGHSKLDGYLIDTHDAPVCDAVWELYRWACAHFGKVSTMIERDGNIPEWSELEQELLHAKEIRNEQKQISL